ncbi:hypothetical protein L6164_017552 [Bauhinia variegata]|uniref:Uncharacterized protein n=1 Tax=Bauhinia variegata TaxID=167791 RepID=A0ACB9N8H0_BAUVA|nr:hypothetical protein L6164_017552 [Bauhinia variegata]
MRLRDVGFLWAEWGRMSGQRRKKMEVEEQDLENVDQEERSRNTRNINWTILNDISWCWGRKWEIIVSNRKKADLFMELQRKGFIYGGSKCDLPESTLKDGSLCSSFQIPE